MTIIVTTLAIFQYMVLDQLTGVILCLVALARTIVFLAGVKVKALNHWSVLAFFILSSIAFSLYFMDWESFTWLQAMPIVGSTVGALAMFMKDVKYLKIFGIIAGSMWLVYEFGTKSYGQLPGELFSIMAQCWSLYVILFARKAGVEPVAPTTQIIDTITSSMPVITGAMKHVGTLTRPIQIVAPEK